MRTMTTVLAIAALLSVGCADTTDAAAGAPKVIKISMSDNRYTPNAVTVSAGEKVTFRFVNEGTTVHEAIIGTEADQRNHAKEMNNASSTDPGGTAGMDGMDGMGDMGGMHHGASDNAVAVRPGTSKELTTSFERSGSYVIGCHEAGHYEAGMKATITVV